MEQCSVLTVIAAKTKYISQATIVTQNIVVQTYKLNKSTQLNYIFVTLTYIFYYRL